MTEAPSPTDKLVVRCVQCDSSFTRQQLQAAEDAGNYGCPACGTDSLPVNPDNDVQVKINTHELRILTIWASNWADRPDMSANGKKTLSCIIQRLNEQLPNLHLTLASEIRSLQDDGHKAELISSDGAVIVPMKEPPS